MKTDLSRGLLDKQTVRMTKTVIGDHPKAKYSPIVQGALSEMLSGIHLLIRSPGQWGAPWQGLWGAISPLRLGHIHFDPCPIMPRECQERVRGSSLLLYLAMSHLTLLSSHSKSGQTISSRCRLPQWNPGGQSTAASHSMHRISMKGWK